MPSKSLRKVQKHIGKKKGRTPALHEKSRDAQRLRRASARHDKLSKVGKARASLNQPLLERITHIQALALERNPPFTPEEVFSFIENYNKRHDEELVKLNAERRPGRPPSTREDLLRQRKSLDEKEFASGYWMPDLQDPKNLIALQDWTGDWVSLSTLKFVRVSQDGAVHESSFPPKGQS